MTLKEFFSRLEEQFFARLERKTGWGKEEVKREFKDAGMALLLEELERKSNE